MKKLKKKNSKIKVRRRWKINPQTRIKQSAKCYSRTREKKDVRKIIKNAIAKGT